MGEIGWEMTGNGGCIDAQMSLFPPLEPRFSTVAVDIASWNHCDELSPQSWEPRHTIGQQTISATSDSASTAVSHIPDWTSLDNTELGVTFCELSELSLLLGQEPHANDSQWTSSLPRVSASASSSTWSKSDAANCPSTTPPQEDRGGQEAGCTKCTSTAKQHKRYHNKQLECPVLGCHQRFSLRLDLKRHLKTIKHGGKKTIQCQWCVKGFTRKDNYKRHLETVHGGG